MPVLTHADLKRLVTDTVARRLQMEAGDLTATTDLRTLRAFSSFAAVDILESLEDALQTEVPPERLSAECLCSVASLAALFQDVHHGSEATTL